MVLLLALAAGCNGCRPDIQKPPTDGVPPNEDTASDTSTETGIDSGPPARCAFEEVEPNNLPTDPQAIPMEAWACGEFATYLDADWFTFTPSQAGWITIRTEAALRGSSANPQILVDGGDESVLVYDGYLTSDPLLVFPAPAIEPYRINLAESNFLFGEDYEWFTLVTLSKEPVDWDFEELEPNDTRDTSQPFVFGQTVFGTISDEDDFDWYKITTTYEGEQTLGFDVTAFIEGSAANLKLVLYDATGAELRTDYGGQVTYDRDPWFEWKVTGIQDLYLLARTEDARGSRFHWYTLSITSTPTE